jgi:alanyl-tRNA synthetase
VAAGVRRIEAMTGEAARHYRMEETRRLKAVSGLLKVAPHDTVERVASLIEERRKLERDLVEARKKLAMGGGGAGAGADIVEVNGVKLMARVVTGVEMKDLKALVDEGKKQIGSGVVAIVAVSEDGKAGAVIGVTADLTSRFNAVDLVRIASETLGGKGGGGRPDMAQAGGPDGSKGDAALAAVRAALG